MSMKIWKVKWITLGILLAASGWLLGEDSGIFIRWWAAAAILGFFCLPLTAFLCSGFQDKGWQVSKVLGIAGAGFGMWLLANCRVVSFCAGACVVVSCLMGAVIWGIYFVRERSGKSRVKIKVENVMYMVDGELVFLTAFLIWTYFAGFHPAAYGTEKFMDYGFMMAMMRSETLPAADLWFAGETINYYYGGQYFAVFLTKLTGTEVAQTYNLMRTLVAGFSFALPFTLVRQMLLDHRKTRAEGVRVLSAHDEDKHAETETEKAGSGRRKTDISKKAAVLGGILAGAGVSLAGNMHYVIIGKLLPLIRKIMGLPEGDYTYWFPNSTRYIGYYPAENDKTIHEFPSYSFVLGDLHAHVVNLMFVLAVICLIYAMVQKYHAAACRRTLRSATPEIWEQEKIPWRQKLKEALLEPYVILFAFFIGLFHWTNYWDFVIYFVMGGMGVIYCNYLNYCTAPDKKEGFGLTVLVSLVQAVWVFLLGTIFALPFTLQFDTMVSGIAIAQNHSRPYQWWMIWGLQVLFTVVFFICLLWDYKKKDKKPTHADLYGVILGISALGLILIPEIVYVRDIYEKEYARSNTMFKLTYQAFLMFGLLMGYGFVRLWAGKRQWIRKTLTTVAFVCFIGCCCYIGTAVHSWFGNVLNREGYQGLDATRFLETNFAKDAAAIRWLNENMEGSPVVLEANGDSYSDYERVSAMTGLPTVLGWYVHEWLWRGDIPEINARSANVETIYTSDNRELVEALLDQYEIRYIFVGKQEREKYELLNEEMLQSLGTKVFEDSGSGTYILRVQ